jgi:hypothetical protein
MTTHRQKRCRHCRVRYSYQASGHGAPDLNDPDWCPDCKQVLLDAFANVPKRVEKVLVPTDAESALDLEAQSEAAHAKRVADAQANPHFLFGTMVPRRVVPGLIDMTDPSNKDRRGITKLDGKTYHWNYWTKDPEGTAQVRVEMERDLETGEDVPWKDLRR